MTDILLGIIALVSIVGLGLSLALIIILERRIMELFAKVDLAVSVLENLALSFESFLDGVIALEPEEFNDEDDNFGDDWRDDDEEPEEEEKPVKAKKKKK